MGNVIEGYEMKGKMHVWLGRWEGRGKAGGTARVWVRIRGEEGLPPAKLFIKGKPHEDENRDLEGESCNSWRL